MKSIKWAFLRIVFLVFNIACACTGGLLGFLFAPVVSRLYFRDYRFWRYTKYYVPMAVNFWKIMWRNLRDKHYRDMFTVPVLPAPMTGPDRGITQITAQWTTGAKDCNTCQRCCTLIECPLLDRETGLCQSYDSFFWRYFNCGRYPLNTKQIDYYGCPKWEVIPVRS